MRFLRVISVAVATTALMSTCSSPVGPSPNNPLTPAPPVASFDVEAELNFCVAETNRYRATLGRAPLTRSSALEAYAALSARDLGLTGQPHQHFRNTNGGGISRAENQGWGSHLPAHTLLVQGLAGMWAEGPGGGHFENMRGPYKELGCGVFVNGPEITYAQEFR